MKDIFKQDVSDEIIFRIGNLRPDLKPLWGKMNPAQMLAHCNVTYAYTYTPENFKKRNLFLKFILKNFIKNYVVSDKPYSKNGKTGPDFIISDNREFEKEKALLIENIQKTQKLGAGYFEGKENFSFGKMTAKEWSTLFYKHLDHHLSQFGV